MNVVISTNVDQASGVPTITATSIPDWMTFTDNVDGTATLAGFPSFELTYKITLTMTDGFGEQSTETFTININEPDVDESNKVEPVETTGTTTTVTVTTDDDTSGGSLDWMILLLTGGLIARQKMK